MSNDSRIWRNRQATSEDMPAILEIFDAATAWLVANDLADQWGSTPPSLQPDFVERMEGWIGDQLVGLAIDTLEQIHSCLVLGFNAPPYLDEEVAQTMMQDAGYIYTLAARKEPASKGSGASLLKWASQRVSLQGGHYLRLDCWADNEALLAYYRRQGFSLCGTYEVNQWRGALLEKSLIL